MSPALKLVASALLATTFVVAGLSLERRELLATLPLEGQAARGASFRGEERLWSVDSLSVWREESLDRRITLTADGVPIAEVTMRALGATIDDHGSAAHHFAFGRTGSWLDRVVDAADLRAHPRSVEPTFFVPVEGVAAVLDLFKAERDERARGALRKIDPDASEDVTTPHVVGRYVDVYATTERIQGAFESGAAVVEIAVFERVPLATSEVVAAADASQKVGEFETRFGGPAGRDQNIQQATERLHGMVIMPGETLSFNERVGARTLENGFQKAPEIYKGEIREGVGGGACQVATTLYAASFFGGLEVVERRNHSRPSAYVRPGLDATVSYPVLDLRLRNPYPFPVIVSAKSDGGRLRFTLFGKEKTVEVALATETKAVLKYSRKVERTAALAPGEVRVKQKGKRGLSLKRVKTTASRADGAIKVEESVDVYPPQQEILMVAPDVKKEDLPPLEGSAGV